MKQPSGSLLDLWYAALASPYGVEVQCSPSFDAVRQKLYALRREAKDEDLKKIAICQSPFDPERLWLVKQETDDASP